MRATSSPISVCAAVIRNDGRWLLAERLAGSHLERHWEFPGGKIHAGETPAECIVREIHEELGVEVECLGELAVICHDYPEKSVELRFLECRILAGAPHGREGQAVGWFSLDEMAGLTLAPADVVFLETLK